jgi:putative intracellular protease/amidase
MRISPFINRRRLAWMALGLVAISAAIFAAWMFTLPPARTPTEGPALAQGEAEAILRALKPPKRQRPVVAIVGINDATEVTDYLMPLGILRRSGVADVVSLATAPGPVKLFPALTVEPDATISDFDAKYPEGADYVIVPQMSRADDPVILEWLNRQAGGGATIVGVCAGARIVAAAGLLDGKQATTHWYYLEDLLEDRPSIRYVADRRLVVDKGVATTTGITASMPFSLTLIEAIAGRATAEAVGRDLGLENWGARHDSKAFTFTRPFATTALRNAIAFWNREQLGIELTPGIDEVALALVADAWSRTYRAKAVTFSRSEGSQQTRNGIRIVPDRIASSWPAETLIPAIDRVPATALDEVLEAIAARYGARTAEFVAMQLEYPMMRAAN